MTCNIFSKGRRQGDRRRLQQWASQSNASSVYPSLRGIGEYAALDSDGFSWGLLLDIIN